MHIGPNTMINGRSHITTERNHGLKFKTESGKQFYNQKLKRVQDAISNGAQESYRKWLLEELAEIEDDLEFFLNDEDAEKMYNMDSRDSEGWLIYNSLMDKHTIIKHFLKKLT